MTAGTVVIIGGLLAAFILLTIVSTLCYCRLQYYCCKREVPVVVEEEDLSSEEEVEEEPEEEETDLSLSPDHPSPPDYFTRSYTPPPSRPPSGPPSGPPSPPYSNKHVLTIGDFEANGPSCLPCGYPFRGVRRPPGYALCPSCTGLLPHTMHRHETLRNGGDRVSYQQPQHDFDVHSDVHSDGDGFRKLNLIRWVTMHEVVARRTFSTDV